MHLARHPRARWRPVVRFADAPTAAIAIIPTRPVQVVRAEPSSAHDPRERGELVPPVPNDRLVAADFSEEVALTSPIPMPRHPHRDDAAAHTNRDVPSAHVPAAHPPARARNPMTGPIPRKTPSS